MENTEEIKKLAVERLEEAEILLASGKCDGAFYLAGYSIELTLKAKICKQMGVPNLFGESRNDIIGGLGSLRQFLKTHNLKLLLLVSRLKQKFDAKKAEDKLFLKATSLLFEDWNEQIRYKPCGFAKQQDVEELIALLKSEEGLIKWIEKN